VLGAPSLLPDGVEPRLAHGRATVRVRSLGDLVHQGAKRKVALQDGQLAVPGRGQVARADNLAWVSDITASVDSPVSRLTRYAALLRRVTPASHVVLGRISGP